MSPMWPVFTGAGFAFGVRLGFGVGFAFDLGALTLGLLDLAALG